MAWATTCPSLIRTMVGMDCTPKAAAMPGSASTSSLPTLMRPAYSPASSSTMGLTMRQGPHQAAHMSSRTGTSDSATSDWKFEDVISMDWDIDGLSSTAELDNQIAKWLHRWYDCANAAPKPAYPGAGRGNRGAVPRSRRAHQTPPAPPARRRRAHGRRSGVGDRLHDRERLEAPGAHGRRGHRDAPPLGPSRLLRRLGHRRLRALRPGVRLAARDRRRPRGQPARDGLKHGLRAWFAA